ncbi:hypothetical protein BJV77DRAFT_1155510 [Russula vinacea]|nr:hypothetical protein BJV77DRAFT_1155510 [Russula vinacea]
MSRTHQRPQTPSSSQGSSTKFKEHLSIAVPPPNPTFEHSRFSPDSPSKQIFHLGRTIFNWASPRSQRFDLEKGTASPGHSRSNSAQSSQHSIKDRFARFFPLREGSRGSDSSGQRAVPIVAPSSEAPVWRLDNSAARSCARYLSPLPVHQRDRPQRSFVFRVASVTKMLSYTTAPPTSAPTGSVMLSGDTQQCLTQYTLNAPGDPTGYPCGTCLPLVTAVPANASAVYPVARDATQFCGLRSIWEDAGQQGQAGLEAGGWVKDIKFCTWSGVRCNGAGRVSSLQLSFPAVPASLPAQFTNLTELESLEIVGNGNSPDFGALTKLTSLHLENTTLGALPIPCKPHFSDPNP